MESSRAKSATPTRDHVTASSSAAASANADGDGEQYVSFNCSFMSSELVPLVEWPLVWRNWRIGNMFLISVPCIN